MPDIKDRITRAQWVFERQLSWISTADVKVGVVVTIDVAMFGGLAAAFSAAQTSERIGWPYFFSTATALLLVAAIICAVGALTPRLKGKAEKSFLYFGLINSVDIDQYAIDFASIDDADMLVDLARQIHVNATIAFLKHKWVKRAILWSFGAAISWFFAIVLLVK